MQLSRNRKTFSQFFCAFPKSSSHFEHFWKIDEPERRFVSGIIDSKKWGYLNA